MKTTYDYARRMARQRRLGLGYAYIVEFATGVVKVGMTTHPKERFNTIDNDSMKHGVPIANWKLSAPHKDFKQIERHLIAFCKDHGYLFAGKEYFEVSFADVLAFARSLGCFGDERVNAVDAWEAGTGLDQEDEVATARGGDGE